MPFGTTFLHDLLGLCNRTAYDNYASKINLTILVLHTNIAVS